MRESTRNFLVGLASAIALLGLAALLMSFGELDRIFNPRYEVTVYTDHASGLRAGSTVEFRGVPIGIVHRIKVGQDPQYPVVVETRINQRAQLPADVKPYANVPLLGAAAILQFRPTQEVPDAMLETDGSAEVVGPMRGGMFAEIAEQLDERMQPIMDSLAHFNRLSETFVALGENLNDMLIPQSPQELTDGVQPNLRTAVTRLNVVLIRAQEGLELANAFLGDEQMRADAQRAVSRASQLIEEATTAVQGYMALAQSLQNDTGALTQRMLPVIDTMGVTLEEVRRMVAIANQGEGTIGHLLNNPDLYNALTDAATRLDRTLVEFQVLIQQLRAEGFMFRF
jgi:phospholipid/cholesterol/gamma-HCH transport system substrate-binding protein